MKVVAKAGQEDHRRGDIALAQRVQHFEAVHLRHAPVQQNHVHALAGREKLKRRAAAGAVDDLEALALQLQGEGAPKIVVIVHHREPARGWGFGQQHRGGAIRLDRRNFFQSRHGWCASQVGLSGGRRSGDACATRGSSTYAPRSRDKEQPQMVTGEFATKGLRRLQGRREFPSFVPARTRHSPNEGGRSMDPERDAGSPWGGSESTSGRRTGAY